MTSFVVDTNVLVYRYDPRDLRKQAAARDLVRRGIAAGDVVVPHQVLIELVAATTRPRAGLPAPYLTVEQAVTEVESLIAHGNVLYPNRDVVLLAMRGLAAYGMSWFDAHLWAYAEHYGIPLLFSEDFQHDRLYGNVRVINPFIADLPSA